jgi:formylglycine-generating enzyme required for sulfatase activity
MLSIASIAFVVVLVFDTSMSSAQNIDDLKKGVVKITAHAEGKTKIGTGFIVRLEKETAYIVTASHVVEGDSQPKVVFRPNDTKVFPAQIKGLEGGDPRGLAALAVEGNLPEGLETLPLYQDFNVTGGEPGTVIGFPRVPAVPWAVTSSVMTGQQGKYLVFSGAAVEGNSGGPIMVAGKAVGVITEVLGQYGYAVPIQIMQIALRGWSIPLDAATKETARMPDIAKGQLPHEVTGKDGAPMVPIPAGEFWMGSPDDEGTPNEHPRHWVYLEAYDMDRFEVTVSRYAEFMQSTGRQAPHDWAKVKISKHSSLPVVGVSWNDAETYCRWAGKRLPTEAEWEKAARGTDERTYPWGDEQPSSGLANFGKAGTRRVYDERLAPVDSYEAGNSPYGLHHMAGNVYEWTADWYDEDFYAKSPQRNPTGPSNGQYRMLRGGSWRFKPIAVRSAHRSYTTPTNQYDYIGFRCARDSPK